jgi:hypothetical protein
LLGHGDLKRKYQRKLYFADCITTIRCMFSIAQNFNKDYTKTQNRVFVDIFFLNLHAPTIALNKILKRGK